VTLLDSLTARLIRLSENTTLPEPLRRDVAIAALEAVRVEAELRAWTAPNPN